MPVSLDPSLVLVFAALFAAAISIYARLVRRLADRGGKVHPGEFTASDLAVCLLLFAILSALVGVAVLQKEPAAPVTVSAEQVLPGAARFFLILFGIVAFLHYRGISISRVFGIERLPWLRALGKAFVLIIAAFPFIAATGALTQWLLHDAAQEQELVQLFRQVAAKGDHAVIAQIFFAGIIVAPLCEEFLFRGYFYGVFKRYFGGLASGLLTAALFAAFHMNLASLPSLFVLAICFTLAYEASGSLLVPIGMHALFNMGQLLALYWQAHPVS